MDLIMLKDYLNQNIPADFLMGKILSEVEDYKKLHSLQGTSINLNVENKDLNIFVNKKSVLILCRDYLEEKITKETLQYLAEIIEAAKGVQYANKEMEDIIFVLANPEINYPMNKQLVDLVVKWLDDYSDQKFLFFLEHNIK